jgi:diaminopimelate decarboxylase
MNHFDYRDGELCAEAVPLAGIAEAVGTPFYCYSTATLVRHYRVFRDAFAGLDAGIYYSLKANSNLGVVRTLAVEGAGADVVSEGELRRALAAGIPAQRIVFSGVGKGRGHLPVQRGIRARARGAQRDRRPSWGHGTGCAAHQSRGRRR